MKIEGLVDASSEDNFYCKLEALEQAWRKRESPHAGECGPQFYNYFKRFQANVVCYHMRKDIRVAAGLGSPPTMFTTNSSEAINSVIKKQVHYKKTQWPEFVKHMKELAESQRNEIIRSLSGRGQYRLSEDYQHLSVSVEKWNKMRPDQRKKVVKGFDLAQLKSSSSGKFALLSDAPVDGASSSSSLGATGTLRISAENSGINSIPLITLQSIWSKAESLVQGENNITPVPGAEKRARAVISYRSDVPHIVKPKGNSQYVCDPNCPQWVSSKICSHTIAVAHMNNSLQDFLDWYLRSTSLHLR